MSRLPRIFGQKCPKLPKIEQKIEKNWDKPCIWLNISLGYAINGRNGVRYDVHWLLYQFLGNFHFWSISEEICGKIAFFMNFLEKYDFFYNLSIKDV